jgi:hypothetical protein
MAGHASSPATDPPDEARLYQHDGELVLDLPGHQGGLAPPAAATTTTHPRIALHAAIEDVHLKRGDV